MPPRTIRFQASGFPQCPQCLLSALSDPASVRSENEKAPCEDGALSWREEPVLLRRLDGDDRLALRTLLRVLHVPGGGGEEGVVLADADVHAGVEARAALPDEDRARIHELAAEGLE